MSIISVLRLEWVVALSWRQEAKYSVIRVHETDLTQRVHIGCGEFGENHFAPLSDLKEQLRKYGIDTPDSGE